MKKKKKKIIELRHSNLISALTFDHGYLEVLGFYNEGLTFYFDYNPNLITFTDLIKN